MHTKSSGQTNPSLKVERPVGVRKALKDSRSKRLMAMDCRVQKDLLLSEAISFLNANQIVLSGG